MEQIEIQNGTNYQMIVDNFIRNICDDNHVYNYYATISVPVLQAVDSVMSHSSNHKATLSFRHCREGLSFSLQCELADFSSQSSNNDDIFLFAEALADKVCVSDNGHSLQMIFAIRGIDATEAARRVSVLEQFSVHSPTPSLVNTLA